MKKGKRINCEDDLVIVYDGNEVIYKGLEDYEPMKYESWKWDEKEKNYKLDVYTKVCIEC